MPGFKAGFIIEEVLQHISSSRHSTVLDALEKAMIFNAQSDREFELAESVDPLIATTYNYISRGQPSRSSLFISEHILKQTIGVLPDEQFEKTLAFPIHPSELNFLFNEAIFKQLTDILANGITRYERINADVKVAIELLITPIAIAKIQKTILRLIASRVLNFNQDFWNIMVIERDVSCAFLAIEDLKILLNQFLILEGKGRKLPKINLKVFPSEIFRDTPLSRLSAPQHIRQLDRSGYNHFDLLLDIGNLDGTYYDRIDFQHTSFSLKIRPADPQKVDIDDRLIFTERIKYPNLGHSNEEFRFNFYLDTQKKALLYFLRNTYRKTSFRPGQLIAINQVLQGKNTLLCYPSHLGKSLVYEFCTFLQSGYTIVILPEDIIIQNRMDQIVNHYITSVFHLDRPKGKDPFKRIKEGNTQLIYTNCQDLLNQEMKSLFAYCNESGIFAAQVVVDEAHCCSQWGHDLRISYVQLKKLSKELFRGYNTPAPILGLTGLAQHDTINDIQLCLNIKQENVIIAPERLLDKVGKRFNIVPIPFKESSGLFSSQEKELSLVKYPIIKRILSTIPNDLGLASAQFFKGKNNHGKLHFSQTGIIFYTPSHPLNTNNSVSLKNYLESTEEYAPELYFPRNADPEFVDQGFEHIQDKQLQSFINDEANILITYGRMGIGMDKPNIRYSVHFNLPASPENFLQESDRAGRIHSRSTHYILYNPKEHIAQNTYFTRTFKDYLHLKKGQKPLTELYALDELLTEVRYEEGFFSRYLKDCVWRQFGITIKLQVPKGNEGKLIVSTTHEKDKLLKKAASSIIIGSVDLRNLHVNVQAAPTFTDALPILEFLKEELIKQQSEGDVGHWLFKRKGQGIEGYPQQDSPHQYTLLIGYSNNIPSLISDVLRAEGYIEVNEQLIKQVAAYATTSKHFINELKEAYRQFISNEIKRAHHALKYPGRDYQPALYQRKLQRLKEAPEELNLNNRIEQSIDQLYYRLRLFRDTERAIFRLYQIGLIDQWELIPSAELFVVKFSHKTAGEYRNNLASYLSRYTNPSELTSWISRAETATESTALRKYLYTLVDFTYEEIALKRERSSNYMKNLCESGIKHGEQVFRKGLINYFYALFAQPEYLPKDTANGYDHFDTVLKYIKLVENTPEGLDFSSTYGKWNTLVASSRKIQQQLAKENASLILLEVYGLCMLATNPSVSDPDELLNDASEKYLKAFNILENKLSFEEWSQANSQFTDLLKNANPELLPMVSKWYDTVFAAYYADWLQTFNHRFFDLVR